MTRRITLMISILLLLLMFGGSVNSYPSGAPSQACSSLTPNHGGSPQSSPLPYTLDLSGFDLYGDGNFYYEPGNIYQLTLSGSTFRGFLLQARLTSDDETLIGSFSNPSSGIRLSSCSPDESGITHSDNSDKSSITGTWTAPPRGTGPIRFRFAVVQQMPTYWADQMSSVVYESGVYLWFDGSVLANNSYVGRGDIGEGEEGITCFTDNLECCSSTTGSGWFSPDGTALHEGADGAETLYATRGAGYVRLNRITGGMSALYWCDIPDHSGTLQRFYAGLYNRHSLTSGVFVSIEVTFEQHTEVTVDPPQFSLACRTQGGPATTVVWKRDGTTVADDGNHTTSQIVLDAGSAIYYNVLVVTGREGGEYECTVSHDRISIAESLTVEVGTDPTNLEAIQQDLSATSIVITWDLPSSPTPTETGFLVIYETAESSSSVQVDSCTECETTISGLTRGTTYSISVVTLSEHLPSNVVGPVTVTLATGCVELGYTDGCCELGACTLNLPGTADDCFCNELCYSLENCCQDILHSCPPPADANLCAMFRGYDCDLNAQCLSVGNEVNNSASYQCVCNQGYIGDGNTTCLGASVEVSPETVLATNGSSGYSVSCLAPSFTDHNYYWILVNAGNGEFNTTIATESVLELPQVVFEDRGARYQCIVETQFGNISSDIVEVIVSPQGGVGIQPSMLTIERGETETLECSGLGGPGNTFAWMQFSTGQQISLEQSLTVTVSSGADGGMYRCSVQNAAGSDTADSTVIVPPAFQASPASSSAALGSSVTLQCTADGYPAPSIEWVHFGRVLRENDETIVVEEERVNATVTITLTVVDIQTESYGEYSCRASTTVGEAVDSDPGSILFTGALTTEECDVTYNLTEPTDALTVGSAHTVCFRCLYTGSVDSTTQWTLDGDSITNSIGTVVDGVLVIFTAAQVFSVDTSSSLQCVGTSTYLYAISIRVLEAPTIPSVIDVEEHSNVSVTCDSSGSIPVTSHTWRDASGTIVSTGVELVLLDVGREQAGAYTCTIDDDMGGTASATTTLNVLIMTIILRFTPSPHLVLIGKRLHLFCLYDGVPEPSAVWLLNGSVVDTTDPEAGITVTSNATYSDLTVENTTDADGGSYSCNVSNSVGSDQASISVDIVFTQPPPVITIRATGSNAAGDTYTLTCSVALIEGSSVTPDIQWLGPDGEHITGGGITVGDVMAEQGVTVSRSLTFNLLLASHAGEYTCRANFTDPEPPGEEIASNQTLAVVVQIPAPSVSIAVPSPQPIYEGTSKVLICTATVSAAADTTDLRALFEWTFEGSSNYFSESRFNFSERQISQFAFESVLEFSPISLRDSGEYECAVVIESSTQYVEAGEGNSTASVSIDDLPPPSVTITDSGERVAGGILTLVCSATVVEDLVSPPLVEFVSADGGPLEHQGIQVANPITEGRITTLTLQFVPLVTSAGGVYTCTATIDIPQAAIGNISSDSEIEVTVTISTPSVLVSPGRDSAVPYAAVEYSLVCSIDVNSTHVDTGTEALVAWINSDGELMSTDRITLSDARAVEGGYTSTVAFSPLSLTDSGDIVCTVDIIPDNSSSFVAASSPRAYTYMLSVMAPLSPNVTLTTEGSGVAGESLQLVCISEYPPDLYSSPTLTITDENRAELEGSDLTLSEGQVQSAVMLMPLLTSHSGLYTCISSYIFPEAGLTDPGLYSTEATITVTVAIPVPRLNFTTVPNISYIGTRTYLNCNVQLAASVDSPVTVTASWVRIVDDGSQVDIEVANAVSELDNNTFQSSVMLSPLTSRDAGNYTCRVMIESNSTFINGTVAEGSYSVVPSDPPEPVVFIGLEQPATLGTDVTLYCMVTVVEGLVYPPELEWVVFPDTTMIDDNTVSDGNVYRRDIEFVPLQAAHGGLYTCNASLSVSNASLPLLSSSQSYSLVVQVPAPTVVITQDPIGNLIVGVPLSLTCTVTVPPAIDVDLGVEVVWTEGDAISEVENSSDGRIVVGTTMQINPNEYESLLRITAISSELDNGHTYCCDGRVNLLQQMEFVSTQSETKNVSLNVVAPPADFQVTATTQTSLSFSWGLPLTIGLVIGYTLECRAGVTGIEDPLPQNTAEQTAILESLYPGISYACSVTATTNIDETLPSAVTTAMTVETAPTGSPLNFVAVPAGARNITFTWEVPEPRLQNGVILSYTIACQPSLSSPLGPVSEAGSVTLNGFAPATTYNCSVSASNSVGSGPLTYDAVTTRDDSTLFQLKLLSVSACAAWVNQENVLKLTDLISATVDNINQQCDCSFSQDGVVDGEFRCFELNADDVTFRAALRGLAQVSSSVLAGYVQQWVASGATVVIQNVRLPLDSNCRDAVIIDSREELECAPAASGTSQGLNTGAAAGISAASVLVAVVIVAIIVLLIVFVCRRRRAHVTLTNLKKVMSEDWQRHGSTAVLLQSRRNSNGSGNGDSDSRFFTNPQYAALTDSTDNPMYSNPTASDLAKHRVPLPLLPTLYEELDGYAVPSTVGTKGSNGASPPSNYLQPVSSPSHKSAVAVADSSKGKSLESLDTSTILHNRSSGIYEDPDYARVSERKPLDSGTAHINKGELVEDGRGGGDSGERGVVVVGEYELPSPQRSIQQHTQEFPDHEHATAVKPKQEFPDHKHATAVKPKQQ